MSLIWDLIQQGQLQKTQQHAGSLEQRINQLESELHQTNTTLLDLLRVLEQKFGEDLDRDGRVG